MKYYSFVNGHHLNLLFHKFDFRNQLLLFDKIAISNLEDNLNELENIRSEMIFYDFEKEYLRKLYDEMKFLYENKIVFDPIKERKIRQFEKIEISKDDFFRNALNNKDKYEDDFSRLAVEFVELQIKQEELVQNNVPLSDEVYNTIVSRDIAYTKFFSLVHTNESETFVPICSVNNQNEIVSHKNMLSVSLKKMPKISSELHIGDVINYKLKSNNILSFKKYTNWLLDIEKSNFKVYEFEQKLDYLIMEYEENLKLHNLKYNVSKFETFATFSLELLENALKLKLSKLAETLFSFKKKKIEMLEAENKLIGNEVSFIVNTKGGFENIAANK